MEIYVPFVTSTDASNGIWTKRLRREMGERLGPFRGLGEPEPERM